MKSKTYLTSNIATLYRNVDGRVRYYKIRVYPTLFGEYLLVREWGGINNKKPTGTKQSYFFNLSNLKDNIKKIIIAKSKKGYNSKIDLATLIHTKNIKQFFAKIKYEEVKYEKQQIHKRV